MAAGDCPLVVAVVPSPEGYGILTLVESPVAETVKTPIPVSAL